ncbi:MAG: hypothetical protein GF398_05790 [Chitinivibrionales bacterium]|nr:hypothetical protein [Chitinivibrionales bacterium]
MIPEYHRLMHIVKEFKQRGSDAFTPSQQEAIKGSVCERMQKEAAHVGSMRVSYYEDLLYRYLNYLRRTSPAPQQTPAQHPPQQSQTSSPIDNGSKAGVRGDAVRFYFANRHYRDELSFNSADFERSLKEHADLANMSKEFSTDEPLGNETVATSPSAQQLLQGFEDALNDDLHTEQVLERLRTLLPPLAHARQAGKLDATNTAGIRYALTCINNVMGVGL